MLRETTSSTFSYALNAYHPDASMLVATRHRNGGNTCLTVIGSTHDDRLPDSPKYQVGHAFLDDWRDRTTGSIQRIIYEGRHAARGATKQEAITDHFGESGFVKWYGDKNNIFALPAEPARRKEFGIFHSPSYENGDGIVTSAKSIIRAIVGVRILPFLSRQQVRDQRDAIATARTIFDQYLYEDARHYVPIDYKSFAEVFEQYFDQPFNIADFTDPDHPNVALARAITEPEHKTKPLANYPKLKELANNTASVQKTRTFDFGRRVLELYVTHNVSVFAWAGLAHVQHLQRALCETDTIYDPAEIRPELREIHGSLADETIPHSQIARSIGGFSLEALINREEYPTFWHAEQIGTE
jgi:hypothetical protein